MLPERMSRAELRAGASLAGVYGLRMLGLFFILPVFAVHAAKLEGGGDLALVGIALGAYGLSQGILQIPFGLASDRWGRKPALYTGLVIFAAGSFLGVAAHDVWTAIAARTLQGAGAINSVAMALAADLTREQHRTKIMAMIGATIGSMFALSLVGAPLLYRAVGMDGIFALTGLLSLAALWVVKFQVPDPPAMGGTRPDEESGARPRGARRADARFFCRLQLARGHAALARLAPRAFTRPRRRDRRVQHDPDAGGVLRRIARRLDRQGLRRGRGVLGLRSTVRRLAGGGGGDGGAGARGQRAFECE